MKAKLQVQEIVESQYAEILDFFDVDTEKDAELAHEELLEVITTFTNKLEKMVQTIGCLESELNKASEENSFLKEKKKKMIRELKRCEQMIEKACLENEHLESRVHELLEKIEHGDNYVKELLKMVSDNSE